MTKKQVDNPILSAGQKRSGPSFWHDEKALQFLTRQLRSDHYDHAVLTGWKSVDLFASADRRAAAFREALLFALDSGRRVSIVIGGILPGEDLNTFLFDLRRVLANRNLRRHFNGSMLQFANDVGPRPFHAKCWVFWKNDSVVDVVVGSFNLSAASFLRNVEAAARPPVDESTALVREIQQALTGGIISPKTFASIEKSIQAKRQATDNPAEKRDLQYLDAMANRQGTAQNTYQQPTTPKILSPTISDYFVVLRDPSRGDRVGYNIPKGLLADIFGKDFLGTKETEMGLIQGPKSLIVPFPLNLAKEYRTRMSAMSSVISIRCTPISVGYVVRDAFKEALRERLDKKFAANEQTKRKMKEFINDQGFSDFLMKQIRAQIGELRNRYARQVELPPSVLDKKLAPKRPEILRLAKQAAEQMLERLDCERSVTFVSLDDLLDLTEGISRAEIEAELAERWRHRKSQADRLVTEDQQHQESLFS